MIDTRSLEDVATVAQASQFIGVWIPRATVRQCYQMVNNGGEDMRAASFAYFTKRLCAQLEQTQAFPLGCAITRVRC
jgi:hypothetical protein